MEHQTGEFSMPTERLKKRRAVTVPKADNDNTAEVEAVAEIRRTVVAPPPEIEAEAEAVVEAEVVPEAEEVFDDISPEELSRIVEPGTYTSMDGFLEQLLPNLDKHTPESFLALYSPRHLDILRIVATRLCERIEDKLENEYLEDPKGAERLDSISHELKLFIPYVTQLYVDGGNSHEHVTDLADQLGEYQNTVNRIIDHSLDAPIPRGVDVPAENLGKSLALAFEIEDGVFHISPDMAAEWFAHNTKVRWEDENPFEGRNDLEELLPIMYEYAVKMGRMTVEDAEWFINGGSEEFGNPHHPEYPICNIFGNRITGIEMSGEELDKEKNPLCVLGAEFHVGLKRTASCFGRHRTGNSKERRTFKVLDIFEITGFDEDREKCIRVVCKRNGKDVWISPKDIEEIYAYDEVGARQRMLSEQNGG